MGKVIISASGGGTTSDECTALRSCVLSPYTAVTSDSNDEPIQGTMQHRSDNPTSTSLRDDGSNLRMYPPSGYYDGVNDYTWDSYATIASRIGLAASDLRTNKRVLGLTGTFTNDAVLNPDMLVEGYSGYDDGVKKNGTMKNRGSYATSLKTAISSLGDRIYAKFPKGAYFDESAASPNPYVHILFTDLARAIGLTPDKIKKGVTIAGVTGTHSGYVAIATDLYLRGNNPAGFYDEPTYFANNGHVTFEAGQISTSRISGGNNSGLGASLNLTEYSKLNFEGRLEGTRNYSNSWINLYQGGSSGEGTSGNFLGRYQIPRPNIPTNFTGYIDISNVFISGKIHLDFNDWYGAIYHIWLS